MKKNTLKNDANIRHIGLVVKNIKKSLEVWEGCFDFRRISYKLEEGKSLDSLMKLKKVEVITCKLKDKIGNVIELLQYKKPISKNDSVKLLKPNSLGLTHLAITVNSINYTLKKLKKFKYKTLSKILMSEDKSVKYIYVKTTDGIYLEIVEKLN